MQTARSVQYAAVVRAAEDDRGRSRPCACCRAIALMGPGAVVRRPCRRRLGRVGRQLEETAGVTPRRSNVSDPCAVWAMRGPRTLRVQRRLRAGVGNEIAGISALTVRSSAKPKSRTREVIRRRHATSTLTNYRSRRTGVANSPEGAVGRRQLCYAAPGRTDHAKVSTVRTGLDADFECVRGLAGTGLGRAESIRVSAASSSEAFWAYPRSAAPSIASPRCPNLHPGRRRRAIGATSDIGDVRSISRGRSTGKPTHPCKASRAPPSASHLDSTVARRIKRAAPRMSAPQPASAVFRPLAYHSSSKTMMFARLAAIAVLALPLLATGLPGRATADRNVDTWCADGAEPVCAARSRRPADTDHTSSATRARPPLQASSATPCRPPCPVRACCPAPCARTALTRLANRHGRGVHETRASVQPDQVAVLLGERVQPLGRLLRQGVRDSS